MKVATVLGTRPEIIRLSRIIPLLDKNCEHLLVHTGQNFDRRLSGLFFEELGVREPDVHLGVESTSFGAQAGQILERIEQTFAERKPDRLLVLGDTNSGLSAVIARKAGIAVFHMEAGNRCFDFRVPEEANRRIIDHVSTVLMPYTERSRENLLREGFAPERVLVTGNPIKEVIDHYDGAIRTSTVLKTLGLQPQKYFLVTLHRAENVDVEERLRAFLTALERIHRDYGYPVICSVHPRTASRAAGFGLSLEKRGIQPLPPFGFFDFIHLERNAFCVLSDSGTVQEEACIFGVPNVTLRDVTERPETVECGSNILTGADPDRILSAVSLATSRPASWVPPREYLATNVADIVGRIVLGRISAATEV